jgi:hypothetical protein
MKLNLPDGPITAEAARSAIRADDGGIPSQEDRHQALLDALRGLELGDTDTLVLRWLATWEPDTVAVVCSWLERIRAQGMGVSRGQ